MPVLKWKSFDKLSKAKAAMEAPNIMKESCVDSTLEKHFHVRVGVRKCNAYGLDHQKCHIYLAPLAALQALQATYHRLQSFDLSFLL